MKEFLTRFEKQSECRFKEKCKLYSETSYTCTHTGGSYCGKYRKLNNHNSIDSTKNDILVITQ